MGPPSRPADEACGMAAIALLKLQKAGFSQEQVEALAEYLDTQAATRSDLLETKAELQRELGELRSELRREIADVRSGLRREIADTKADLVRWVVGIGFAQVATILTVLKLFPGGHP